MEFKRIRRRKKPNKKRALVMLVLLLLIIYLWKHAERIITSLLGG